MTREEVIGAILECTERLGHVPSRVELEKLANINRHQVRRHFGTYAQALRECNLPWSRGSGKLDLAVLFREWAGIARNLRKLPTVVEYEKLSRYSQRPLTSRFGTWGQVPAGLKQYAQEHGLVEEWQDVMALIEERYKPTNGGPTTPGRILTHRTVAGRPMYGELLRPCPLLCAPTNENGVMFLFGALATDLGFMVLRIQIGFPDVEAFRVVEGGRLQRVKIELEQESRNFLRHMHDLEGCDLIVCWEHNWPECPVEVIELKKIVGNQPWMIGENKNP